MKISPYIKSIGDSLANDPPPEAYTFAELVKGREKEFPILAIAAPRTSAAKSVEISWVTRDRQVLRNYQQIVRCPYDARPVEEGSYRDVEEESKQDSLTKFLAACETILRDGVPYLSYSLSGMPLRSCGGIFHYLHRKELLIGDRIRLRPLREPIYRRFTWWMDSDGNWVALDHIKGEWLAEFSLEVEAQ